MLVRMGSGWPTVVGTMWGGFVAKRVGRYNVRMWWRRFVVDYGAGLRKGGRGRDEDGIGAGGG